jgi:hypothetical protein
MGVVTINGHPQTVDKWGKDQILVKLPLTGPDSSGAVVVESMGRKSNPRMLTEWKFKLRYTWYGEDVHLQVNGDFTLRFRADVGSYRDVPSETPRKPIRTAIAASDGGGNMIASGSLTEGSCTTTWSGSINPGVPTHTPVPDDIIVSSMELNTQTRAGFMGLGFGAKAIPFNMTVQCSGSPPVNGKFAVAALTKLQHTFENPGDPALPAVPLYAMPLNFAADFSLPAGVVEEVDPHLRWEWDAVTPIHPPNTTDARHK